MKRKRVLLLTAAAVLGCVLLPQLFAQEQDNEQQESQTETSTKKVEKIKHDPPAPGVLKQIDKGFGKVVGAMAKVLFYKVGAGEKQFITYEHVEHYVRGRGKEGPFKKHDPNGSYEEEELTAEEVGRLSAAGKLVDGDAGEKFRLGKIGDEKIEYVTIKLDQESPKISNGDTYVKLTEDGKTVYRKETKPRGVPSDKDEDMLTEEQVEGLAEKGWLKSDKKTAVSEDKPWLSKTGSGGAPLVVVWLAAGAVFFTLYMGFVNIWGFKHSVEIVRGKYDNPDEDGEVTHFQALASALSATVGLGNIAGVTIAMTVGGPGAFFWMILCGLFGMTSKFTECTLGQKYRTVKEDGTVLGGPFRYLRAGLAEMKLEPLGAVLATVFAIMCVLASFGGGNMFQANQSGSTILATLQHEKVQESKTLKGEIKEAAEKGDMDTMQEKQAERKALEEDIKTFKKNFLVGFGFFLSLAVAVVIIGGIKRIGKAAEKVVPTMCGLYLLACFYIIGMNLGAVPALVGSIFTEAFSGAAMGGGLIGVLIIGVQRAAFSNEAGVGSAAIAHSAAKTDEPVREGAVALLGPFIDTVIVCSITALVILITNAWNNPEWVVEQELQGAALTAQAFRSESPINDNFFPWVLCIAVVMFAYSTIISWSYYGERSWEQLFGSKSTIIYKVLAVTCVFIGTIAHLGAVLDFSDMMILSMAFPNILGAVLLAPKVKRDLKDYWKRYKNKEFKEFK